MILEYDNEEDALQLIKKSTNDFYNMSDRLKNDKKFILRVLDSIDNNKLFIYAILSKELKDDKEFLLDVIKRIPFAIIHTSDRLKNDKDVAIAVFETNPNAMKYISNNIQEQLKDIKSEDMVQYLQYLIKKEAAENLTQELGNKNTQPRRIKI